MRHSPFFPLLLLFALAMSAPAAAKIYKWVDKDGKTHYTQSPPPEDAARSKTMKGSTGKPPPARTASASPSSAEKYCTALARFSTAVAQERRKGARSGDVKRVMTRLDQRLQNQLGTAETYLQQVVAFVYGLVPSTDPAKLVYQQCKSGSYGGNKIASRPRYATGTGWPVSSGLVVTNYHVVRGAQSIKLVLPGGAELPARLFEKFEEDDVAFLSVDKPAELPPALPVSLSDDRLGGEVFTIGYPHPKLMGKAPKLTTGNISALAGIKDDPRMYQISVPLQGGNSGGPLVNETGVVVGIVTAKIRAVDVYRATGDLPENVNYAVKSSTFVPHMNAVAERHKVTISTVQRGEGSVADIVSRIQDSVLMVISE